jgi:hypothetical protein
MPKDDPLTQYTQDLIAMVQRARRDFDAAHRPSQVDTGYWLEARPMPPAATPVPHNGEWRFLVPPEQADAAWERVRAATEAGQLGPKSKIATTPIRYQGQPRRLICARVRDAADAADIARVQQALAALTDAQLVFHPDDAEPA